MLTDYSTYGNYLAATPPMDEAQFAELALEVSAAIKSHCKQNIEATVYSNVTLSAPTVDRWAFPERPVHNDGNLSLSLNCSAYGNVSQFTSDHALTLYSDYTLRTDGTNASLSSSGVVQRLPLGQPWSTSGWVRPGGMLTPKQVPVPGAILASWRGGYVTVPGDIVMAANMAVAILYQRRTLGLPIASTSRGAWSVSYAGPASAEAIIRSPDVSSLLLKYVAVDRCMGWPV